MKLNMGCGHNKVSGWINVDLFETCGPDVVCDLEALPWPWPDDSVDRVMFNHSLEHLGQSTRTFLGIMKELYRVCAHGAEVEINVPHPRHDDFLGDPTHVRVITPDMLALFDRWQCDEWQRQGCANSPLAHYLGVDFAIAAAQTIYAEPYATQHADGLISDDDLDQMCRELNNVARGFHIVLRVRKGR